MLRVRLAERRVIELARQYRAVVVVGPRHIGKSSLTRRVFPGYAHVDFDDPEECRRVNAEPRRVLEEHPKLVLDEVQRLPEVFPLVRRHLDRHPRSRVVLVASAAPDLVDGLPKSLGARAGFFELGGVSIAEEESTRVWERGGYPSVHWGHARSQPEQWYLDYVQTCLDRDIGALGFRMSSSRRARFRNLLGMVAHAQGWPLNLSAFGAPLGLSHHSVSTMLDLLEGLFLVRRLPAYPGDCGKWVVKKPRLYVRDTGVLHALLGVAHAERAVLADAQAESSFATFCVEQLILHANLQDPGAEAFTYQTYDGEGIDLLLKLRGRLIPISVKLNVVDRHVRGLKSCMERVGVAKGYIVTPGLGRSVSRRDIVAGNLEQVCQALQIAGRLGSRAEAGRARVG
jgi:predicted AAA+ superfamily ATPase